MKTQLYVEFSLSLSLSFSLSFFLSFFLSLARAPSVYPSLSSSLCLSLQCFITEQYLRCPPLITLILSPGHELFPHKGLLLLRAFLYSYSIFVTDNYIESETDDHKLHHARCAPRRCGRPRNWADTHNRTRGPMCSCHAWLPRGTFTSMITIDIDVP